MAARTKQAKKATKKKKTAAKRTLVAPKGDKRYVRRSAKGRFKESDDVGRSLSTDRRKRSPIRSDGAKITSSWPNEPGLKFTCMIKAFRHHF